MIWASVAPPLRWSRPRTVAFLLPSRAAAGLLPALPRFPLAALAGLALAAVLAFLPCFAAALALLARFGAVVAASAGLPPSRLWIAFQIRLTADFRSVNLAPHLSHSLGMLTPWRTHSCVPCRDSSRRPVTTPCQGSKQVSR